MKEKIENVYRKARNEITQHPLSYTWLAGVTAGSVAFYVGSTWRKDLLVLPHGVQKRLVADGGLEVVTYVTKRGTFHVIPTQVLNLIK